MPQFEFKYPDPAPVGTFQGQRVAQIPGVDDPHDFAVHGLRVRDRNPTGAARRVVLLEEHLEATGTFVDLLDPAETKCFPPEGTSILPPRAALSYHLFNQSQMVKLTMGRTIA